MFQTVPCADRMFHHCTVLNHSLNHRHGLQASLERFISLIKLLNLGSCSLS